MMGWVGFQKVDPCPCLSLLVLLRYRGTLYSMTLEYTAHPAICRPDARAALYKTALSREGPFSLYRRCRNGQKIFVCPLEKTSSNILGFKYGRCIHITHPAGCRYNCPLAWVTGRENARGGGGRARVSCNVDVSFV